jgi:hypothetical protein
LVYVSWWRLVRVKLIQPDRKAWLKEVCGVLAWNGNAFGLEEISSRLEEAILKKHMVCPQLNLVTKKPSACS